MQRHVWIPTLAVIVLGLTLTLPLLGTSGLWDPWEPRYAQAAREMSERGDWVVPYWRGEPRLNRPPVTYWLIGVSQALFGVTDTAARLPSALLAVLCAAALTLALALRRRSLEGFLAGAALLTSPQWLLLGRTAMLSMPHAAFLGLALALALIASGEVRPGTRRAALLGTVVCIALAALTDWPRGLLLAAWAVLGWGATRMGWKGLAGLLVVATVYHVAQLTYSTELNLVAMALALILSAFILRYSAGISWTQQALAAALLGLIVVPWFVALYQTPSVEVKLFRYKYAFNLGESEGDHTGPYHDVARILLVGALPWIGAAAAGLLRAFGRKRDTLARGLAGVWVGMMLFFTLAEARMGHFYVALQPALAVLAAIGVVSTVRQRRWGAALVVAATLVIGWLLVWEDARVLLETMTVKRHLFEQDPLPMATIAILGWAAVFAVAWVRRRESWTLACVLPAAVLAGGMALQTIPALGPKKSAKTYWTRYLAEREGEEPLAFAFTSTDSGYYYSNLDVVRLREMNELRDFLARPGSKFLVMRHRTYDDLEGRTVAAGDRWTVLDRSHPAQLLARYDSAPPGQ